MLPEVHAIPRVGNSIVLPAPLRAAPENVILRREEPSATLLKGCAVGGEVAIHVFLPLGIVKLGAAPHSLVVDIVDKRHVELAEVCHFGRPVVHLHVDVRVDVAVPRRMVRVVPDALQIAWQRYSPSAAEHEVAPVAEI